MLGTSRVIIDQGDVGAPRTKPVIGLSGGIGAGKSAVAAIIRELGGGVIDSDRMAHEEMEIPEVRETFRSWWGDRVVGADGRIDRKAVADLLFEEPSERSRMERFLYPRLERRREALMESFDNDSAVKVVVIDSPLLYEFGLDQVCDSVIFVDCDRKLRLGRLAQSRGWAEAEMDRREKLQKPVDVKRESADYRVSNNSDVGALRSQVHAIVEQILGEALAC